MTLPEVKRKINSEWGNGKDYWKSLLTGVDMVLHSAEILDLHRHLFLANQTLRELNSIKTCLDFYSSIVLHSEC